MGKSHKNDLVRVGIDTKDQKARFKQKWWLMRKNKRKKRKSKKMSFGQTLQGREIELVKVDEADGNALENNSSLEYILPSNCDVPTKVYVDDATGRQYSINAATGASYWLDELDVIPKLDENLNSENPLYVLGDHSASGTTREAGVVANNARDVTQKMPHEQIFVD